MTILYSASCRGICGGQYDLCFPCGVEDGLYLWSRVSPEGAIGFLVDDVVVQLFCDLVCCLVCLLWGLVPRISVDNGYLCGTV